MVVNKNKLSLLTACKQCHADSRIYHATYPSLPMPGDRMKTQDSGVKFNPIREMLPLISVAGWKEWPPIPFTERLSTLLTTHWEVIYSFFSNTGYSSTGYTSTAAEICGQLHFKKKIQAMPPQTFVLETPFLDAGSTFVGFAVPNCWICHSFSANCNNAFGGHSLGSALN